MGRIKVKPSNARPADWLVRCFNEDSGEEYPLDWEETDDGYEADIEWQVGQHLITCDINARITVEIDVEPQWPINDPPDDAWPVTRSLAVTQTGDFFPIYFVVAP